MKKSFFIIITILLILFINSNFILIRDRYKKIEIIGDLEYKISQLNYLNDLYLEDISALKILTKSNLQNRTEKVEITFYSPELGGINTDGDPDQTALLEPPISGWTCAISRDLVKRGWLGKTLYISKIGIRYASDIMADSYKGKKIRNHIDICVGKNEVKTQAHQFGKNKNIFVSVIK